MEEKYGKEQVSLLRNVVSTWGLAQPLTRASLSAERFLRTMFGIILSTNATETILRVGSNQKSFPDDKFGTVTGYVQLYLGEILKKVRPAYNFVLSPLIHIKTKVDYKAALDEFNVEMFDTRLYGFLEEEERNAYDEIKQLDDLEEKTLALWSFLSDLFISFRAGRQAPMNFTEQEPEESISVGDFHNLVDDDDVETEELASKPIRMKRKSQVSSVTQVLDEEGIKHRVKTFGKNTYVLFTEAPPSLFSIIGDSDREIDLSWVTCQKANAIDQRSPVMTRKAEDEVVQKKEVTSVCAKKEVVAESNLAQRYFDAKMRSKRVNQVGDEEADLIKYGSVAGKKFFKNSLSINNQRRVASYIRTGSLQSNVESVRKFFEENGAGGVMEAEEVIDLILCRLATMQLKYNQAEDILSKN